MKNRRKSRIDIFIGLTVVLCLRVSDQITPPQRLLQVEHFPGSADCIHWCCLGNAHSPAVLAVCPGRTSEFRAIHPQTAASELPSQYSMTRKALLKGEEGVHAGGELIFLAAGEDRLVGVIVADFGPQQQVRQDVVIRERFDGQSHGGFVVVGADRRTVGESIGGVLIPLQAGVKSEVRIYLIAEILGHAAPLLVTT